MEKQCMIKFNKLGWFNNLLSKEKETKLELLHTLYKIDW